MLVFGSGELKEDVQDKALCVNCGACTGICPYHVSFRGRVSQLFQCPLPQGRCYANCPKTEVDYEALSQTVFQKAYSDNRLGHVKKTVKARQANISTGEHHQNGGSVSALIRFMLDNDYIDAAALTGSHGFMPAPELVTEAKDVARFASTKYMASPTASLINKAADHSYTRLGFVGTPCQIAASAKIKSNALDRDDFVDRVFFSIGLFCTWALDARRFMEIASNYTKGSPILKTDVPPPPKSVMEITTEKERVSVPLDEIRQAVPAGCSLCPDLTSEFADISVGVYEKDPAWNLMLIRSDKGVTMVDEAVEKGYLITETAEEDGLSMLKQASANKKRSAFRAADEAGLLNTTGENGRAAMRLASEKLETIMNDGGNHGANQD